MIYWLIIGQR